MDDPTPSTAEATPAAPASSRRSGLWTEVALALALITLATLVLSSGVFWMLIQRTEEERRTDLALSLSTALTAQLEVESSRGAQRDAGYRRVLSAYRGSALDVEELYVADASMQTIASVAGQAPTVPDTGLRAALYGNQQFINLTGQQLNPRFVQVTSPIAPRGRAVAALRVSVPLKAPAVPGGLLAFALIYVGGSFGLVTLFGYALFRRSVMQPVQALVQGTARIAGGDFGYQVELDAARELTGLRDALNVMSLSLAGYQAHTREQLEHLEAANAELQTAQEALLRTEKLASVGRLAAGFAHEVGNPLSAVLGYVDLLGQDLGDRDLEADLISRARVELDRINRIIRDMLDFARPGTGRAEDVEVAAAFEEARATVAPTPTLKDITLSLDTSPDLPAVRIERDKLHQVLVNLLLNAGDALRGKAGAHVDLSARLVDGPAGPEVELRCCDDGPGFGPVALDRALEPFFTTKDVGAGTGLGLATCLQVIEGAGGRMRLGNRPKGGACVSLWLPPAPAEGGT